MGPRNKQKTALTIADMETVADLISSRWFLVNFLAPLTSFDIRSFALLCIFKYAFSNYIKSQFNDNIFFGPPPWLKNFSVIFVLGFPILK